MNLKALSLLILAGPVLGQSLPDNAAAQSMKNRIKTLNLQPPPKYTVIGRAATPFCAIPPVTVVPAGHYRMPVAKPPGSGSRADAPELGAPVCDMKGLQNR